MKYSLWDTDIAKLLGAYRTEDEALAMVRTLVAQYGHDYAADLSLGVEHDDGTVGEPLSGVDLLARDDVARSNPDSAHLRPNNDRPGRLIAPRLKRRSRGASPAADGRRPGSRNKSSVAVRASRAVQAQRCIRRRSG